MTELKITQADRVVAANYGLDNSLIFSADYEALTSGRRDDNRLVQAFARHRADSKAELVELLEKLRDHVVRHARVWDDAGNGSHHHLIWLEVAEALARVKGEG